MGLLDFQSHIVQSISDATELVDLVKLPDRRARDGSLQLVIDGECCLDRLYGGYYPDWVCGGQWNKMDQFLCNFTSVVQNSKLDLVVFLNGSLESERLSEWCKHQEETYRFLQEIHQHVSMKRKPPPKIWWVPPAFLRSAIRIAFRSLNMKIMCSLEDHHKEIVRFIKKNHFNGIIADDSEYLVFEPQRYFSAQKLKLTFKGSLETVEMKLTKVFSTLNIPKERFHIFATLLGNHIVPEKDLSAFYTSLDIQESQQKTAVIEAVAQFVRDLDTIDRGRVVTLILDKSHTKSSTFDFLQTLRENLVRCLKYYGSVTVKNPNSNNRTNKNTQVKNAQKEKSSVTNEDTTNDGGNAEAEPSTPESAASATLPSDCQTLESANVFEDEGTDGGATGAAFSGASGENTSPVTNGDRSGDAPAGSRPKDSSLTKLLYRVVPQIDIVAMNRHRGGLMSPYICQILKNREIKLPVIIEDVNSTTDLPHTHLVFRPLRQRVYAILFNLHHLHFLAKERGEPVPKIEVKETYYNPTTKTAKTDVVRAVEIGWGVPTIEKLWLGDGDECKRKRVRAFLSTMKSDKQIFLDSSVVPQHLLVLCCVLRFLVYEKKLLRQVELDGLIAQALIQELTDVNVAQDIEVSNLTMRGVHISHLFMEGVEMALLVNDACGSPIPYMLFAPWLFYNGKIFNFILEEQINGKTIAEICGFKMDIVYNMERLKTAILDGIKVQFAPNPYVLTTNVPVPLLNSLLQGQFGRLPCQFTQALGQNGGRGGMGLPLRRNAGGVLGNPGVFRNPCYGSSAVSGFSQYEDDVGFSYQTSRVPRNPHMQAEEYGRVDRRAQSRGAQLQVAGTVVGSWGANNSQSCSSRHNPPFYGFSRSSVDQIPRNPFMYSQDHGSHFPMNAVFQHMRISQGNKVPNRGHSSTNWIIRNKPQSKQQKKSIMKKNENSLPDSQGESNGDTAVASSSRTRGVSFIDEPHSIPIPLTRKGENTLETPE